MESKVNMSRAQLQHSHLLSKIDRVERYRKKDEAVKVEICVPSHPHTLLRFN